MDCGQRVGVEYIQRPQLNCFGVRATIDLSIFEFGVRRRMIGLTLDTWGGGKPSPGFLVSFLPAFGEGRYPARPVGRSTGSSNQREWHVKTRLQPCTPYEDVGRNQTLTQESVTPIVDYDYFRSGRVMSQSHLLSHSSEYLRKACLLQNYSVPDFPEPL